MKPDPCIFRPTAEPLRVDPARCRRIVDSATEDGGAIAAGVQWMISEPSAMWRIFERVAEDLG